MLGTGIFAVIGITAMGGMAAVQHIEPTTQVDANGCSINHVNMSHNNVDCSTVGPMVQKVVANPPKESSNVHFW